MVYIRKNSIYIFLVANKRRLRFAFLWGIPFAISCVLGWRLVHEGTVFGPGGSAAAYAESLLLFILETAVLSVPAAAFAAVVMGGGRWKSGGKERNTEPKKRKAVWLFYSLCIFLCWLPVFLAYYPSVFAYDAEGQLYQVLAGDYSTHHPLVHTLFLGAFFRLGIAAGSCSAGMAVHSVVQMALMACAFGWALCFLYQRRVSGRVRALLFLFFAFFPANSVLAVSTTKDVLFAALVLLYTLSVYRVVCKENASEKQGAAVRKKELAVCVFCAVFMLLFRNNAVYAFVAGVPVIYAGLGERRRQKENGVQDAGVRKDDNLQKKKARKIYVCMTLLALALYGVCAFLLKTAVHAQNGSPREMLSVPLQQMARTRVKEEEEIAPALRQELEKYISSEWVFAAYNPHLADPVKSRAVIHDDPAGLIRTWVRLGLAHPAVYIDAFLDNSLGLWYLWDTSHAQVYGIGTESGFGYLSTDNRVMPAGFEVEEHSLLPGLRIFLERIVSDNEYSKIPVVRLLFAPALYWWLLWMYLVTALYRKTYKEALPAVFLATYYLTLLLSPTVLVRYAYPLMVTISVLLPCLLAGAERESENTQ